jgi:DNA-binding transcriptional LysR family regulator
MIAVRVADKLRLVVIASRAYLEDHGRPKTPHDLLSRACIRIRLPRVGLLPWHFARNGKSFEVAVDGALVVNDVPLALRAARDGLGLPRTHPNRVFGTIPIWQLSRDICHCSQPVKRTNSLRNGALKRSQTCRTTSRAISQPTMRRWC